MYSVKQIQDAIWEDCLTQRNMEESGIDRILRSLPTFPNRFLPILCRNVPFPISKTAYTPSNDRRSFVLSCGFFVMKTHPKKGAKHLPPFGRPLAL